MAAIDWLGSARGMHEEASTSGVSEEASQAPKVIPDSLRCSICLQLFKSPIILNCGHSYCHKCLKDLLQSSCLCSLDNLRITQITPNVTLRKVVADFRSFMNMPVDPNGDKPEEIDELESLLNASAHADPPPAPAVPHSVITDQVAAAQRWAIGWTVASYATCGILDFIGYKSTVSLIFNEWTTGWNIGVSTLGGFLISAFNIGLLEGFVPQRFRELWDAPTLRTSLFFACSSAIFAANQWGTYRTLVCPPLALFVLIALQAGMNADMTFTEQPKKILLFSWLATLALHRLLP